MKKNYFNCPFFAVFFVIMVVCSGCEKPNFSSVTGKWEFRVSTATWVLNPENAVESENPKLCYKDSCYYLSEDTVFDYSGVIKKTEEKHVYDIHFMEGRCERVKIEQWPETDFLFIRPEHMVRDLNFDKEFSMIYKREHQIRLKLYIGYGIKELDDSGFVPEHGADTIVSMEIWGTKLK